MKKYTQPYKVYKYLKACPNRTANRVDIGKDLFIIDVPKAVQLWNRDHTNKIVKISTAKNGTAIYQLQMTEQEVDWNRFDWSKIEGNTVRI